MGGLSRKSAYIRTLNKNGIDPVILDAGDALFEKSKFLDSELKKEKFKAASFLHGMEMIGCDALNIGQYDLVGGVEFLKELEKNSNIPFISANLLSLKNKQLIFKPYVIIKKNDLKIGIIGVTDNIANSNPNVIFADYISEGQKYINKIRDEVDILIMLVNGSINNQNHILESFKQTDYVYLSRAIMNTRTTLEQNDGMPIFYTFGLNGKYLIDVRTVIVNDIDPLLDISAYEKRIESYARQLIRLKKTEEGQSLEEKFKNSPQVLKQIENYENQVEDLEKKIKQAVNKSELKVVPLPENMDYDKSMQKYVDNVLEQIKN